MVRLGACLRASGVVRQHTPLRRALRKGFSEGVCRGSETVLRRCLAVGFRWKTGSKKGSQKGVLSRGLSEGTPEGPKIEEIKISLLD